MPNNFAQRLVARFLILSPLVGLFAALLFLAASHALSVSAANPADTSQSVSPSVAPAPKATPWKFPAPATPSKSLTPKK
jgi:hypothetical protein